MSDDPFYIVDAPKLAHPGSEITIQSLFRSRARIMCPGVSIVAVPNGTHIASQAGRGKAQREGLSSGFPDVICTWPGGGIAFIEFKAKTGSLSANQKEWLNRLARQGHLVSVRRHPDTALDWLRHIGAPFLSAPDDARPIGVVLKPIVADLIAKVMA